MLETLYQNDNYSQICHDVHDICNPIRDKYNIEFFDYARIYDDNTCFILSNNKDIITYLFETESLLFAPVPLNVIRNKFYYFLPNTGPYQSVIHYVRKHFNLENFIDFFEINPGYVDVCSFGTISNNATAINFYLNNIDLLENFIKYFKNKASGIIKSFNNNRIKLDRKMLLNFNSQYVSHKNSMGIDNILIKYSCYTKCERNILRYIVRGKTAKEIANIIGRSKRTLEHHLENIKLKTGFLSSKSALIEKIIDENLL